MNITIPAPKDSVHSHLPELLLRPPQRGDEAAIAGMMRDPHTAEWTIVPVPFTDAHRDKYVEMSHSEWDNDWPRWFVTQADTGTVLGSVGLRKRRHSGAELRYQTAPWARGQYVASRAAHAACRYAFDVMGTQRLTWDAIVGNHASRLIAKRLGFQMEGLARSAAWQRDERVDFWIAAMLPDELRDPFDPPHEYELWRRHTVLFHRQQPTIDTSLPGLRLRPPREDDAEALVATCNDPESVRWTTVPQPYHHSDALSFINDYAAGHWKAGTMAVFALADADDHYCGTIDLRVPQPDVTSVEIGFSTAPRARGKGYMTAATIALRDFAFDNLGVDRVVWKAYVGNEASRRVAEKSGFTMEGTLRQESRHRGELRDTWIAAAYRGDK